MGNNLINSSEFQGAFATAKDDICIDRNTYPAQRKKASYGIQEVVNLMRDLPDSNQEAVVAIVKQTLESAEIKISEIIVDGEFKESDMTTQINNLNSEIERFQSEIEKRKIKITQIKQELQETNDVKNLLKIAQKSQIIETLSKKADSCADRATTQTAAASIDKVYCV